jgi:hypothetical protein
MENKRLLISKIKREMNYATQITLQTSFSILQLNNRSYNKLFQKFNLNLNPNLRSNFLLLLQNNSVNQVKILGSPFKNNKVLQSPLWYMIVQSSMVQLDQINSRSSSVEFKIALTSHTDQKYERKVNKQ